MCGYYGIAVCIDGDDTVVSGYVPVLAPALNNGFGGKGPQIQRSQGNVTK